MRVRNSKAILRSIVRKGRGLDRLDGMFRKIENSDPSRLENLLHFNGATDSFSENQLSFYNGRTQIFNLEELSLERLYAADLVFL